ncbi:MAG: hypothetical protein ACRCX8_16690 [Sarcina sp.]
MTNIIEGKFNRNIILKVARPLYSTKHHDKKHNWEHIGKVRQSLKNFSKDYNLREDEINTLYVAIIFHDCVMKNRDKHHENSADKLVELIKSKAFLKVDGNFKKEDREFTQTWLELHMDFIYQCIFEHRSSINAKKKSELGYITSLLDFGYPFPLEKAYHKAIRRGICKVQKNFDLNYEEFEEAENFDWILDESDKWFRKRWLNLKNPRDIMEDEQIKLKNSYTKNKLGKVLVDLIY